jgi:hypothetical protein
MKRAMDASRRRSYASGGDREASERDKEFRFTATFPDVTAAAPLVLDEVRPRFDDEPARIDPGVLPVLGAALRVWELKQRISD